MLDEEGFTVSVGVCLAICPFAEIEAKFTRTAEASVALRKVLAFIRVLFLRSARGLIELGIGFEASSSLRDLEPCFRIGVSLEKSPRDALASAHGRLQNAPA